MYVCIKKKKKLLYVALDFIFIFLWSSVIFSFFLCNFLVLFCCVFLVCSLVPRNQYKGLFFLLVAVVVVLFVVLLLLLLLPLLLVFFSSFLFLFLACRCETSGLATAVKKYTNFAYFLCYSRLPLPRYPYCARTVDGYRYLRVRIYGDRHPVHEPEGRLPGDSRH